MHKCLYCDKQYNTKDEARSCLDAHDIIYMPIARTDLNRLANFILTGNAKLLSEPLTRIIFKYFRKE